jgi:hypothetical protein
VFDVCDRDLVCTATIVGKVNNAASIHLTQSCTDPVVVPRGVRPEEVRESGVCRGRASVCACRRCWRMTRTITAVTATTTTSRYRSACLCVRACA